GVLLGDSLSVFRLAWAWPDLGGCLVAAAHPTEAGIGHCRLGLDDNAGVSRRLTGRQGYGQCVPTGYSCLPTESVCVYPMKRRRCPRKRNRPMDRPSIAAPG